MSFDPFSPAREIAARVRRGAITAEAVTASFLERIRVLDPAINAFTDVTAERALRDARALDLARADGRDIGPLAGVPFAAKNLFDIAGLPTRAGSRVNRERAPATADAELVRRFSAAGAVLLGGLNMGEYAYDFTGENAHDGACRNPHDPARMAGGSSSGSGAATAAGFAPLSLGSDTNGSIRVPSALCGIWGLKPTYGRLPRTGTFPFCDSLDHLGPFARSVEDLALAYDVLQGPDPRDHACAGRAADPVAPVLEADVTGLRVAVAGGWFSTEGLPEAAGAVERVASALGARRIIPLDGAEVARAAAFLITNVESAAFHLPRLRSRADEFDPDTRDRFLAGALLPASWYVEAQRARRVFHDRMMEIFRDIDIIIAPATPFVAPLVGQAMMELRGELVPVRSNLGLFTQPLSAIGLPVVAAPVPLSPLPIGVQIVAAPWREDLCFRVARALESAGVCRAPAPIV